MSADVIGTLPIDECYKMESARSYRGVWIDEFEGQAFIPEGAEPPKWPSGRLNSRERLKRLERAVATNIWLDVDRVKLAHKWRQGGRRAYIEFIGRKTKYGGNYGHLGLSGQEIIVDRVISLKECPVVGICD